MGDEFETQDGSWSHVPEAGDPTDILNFLEEHREEKELIVTGGPEGFRFGYRIVVVTDEAAVLRVSKNYAGIAPAVLHLKNVGDALEMYILDEYGSTYIGDASSATIHG